MRLRRNQFAHFNGVSAAARANTQPTNTHTGEKRARNIVSKTEERHTRGYAHVIGYAVSV